MKKFPELQLIFGHSGLEENSEVIELMEQYPQTYADISTQIPRNTSRMIRAVCSERLLLGSDYPFFNQAFPMLSILRATENDQERLNIFSANAKRIDLGE